MISADRSYDKEDDSVRKKIDRERVLTSRQLSVLLLENDK